MGEEYIDLDFSGTDDGYPIYIPGVYTGRIVDARIGESGQKKTPQISVQIELTDGPDERVETMERPTVFDNWYHKSPKYKKRLKWYLSTILNEPITDSFQLSVKDLIGYPVKFVLDVDEYEGVEKNKISRYLPMKEELPEATAAF